MVEIVNRLGPERGAPAGSGRVMMMLGEIPFELSTTPYQRLRRYSVYNWPAQERIGRRDALQYTGQAAETITLQGTLYPEITGGRNAIETLRAAAGTGEPMDLVDGLGYVYGPWCIVAVADTSEVFFDNGIARKIGFSLSLSRYGDDQPNTVAP